MRSGQPNIFIRYGEGTVHGQPGVGPFSLGVAGRYDDASGCDNSRFSKLRIDFPMRVTLFFFCISKEMFVPESFVIL